MCRVSIQPDVFICLHSSDMDTMYEVYFAHELRYLELDEIPPTKDPVWILGKSYNSKDRDLIKEDVLSRLWFSYRKGFAPIGESGLTSDKGWGCMLRCGQMLLAQAFLFLHLGRDWKWSVTSQKLEYLNILKLFEDRPTAHYSIHRIALTGVDSENKQVGSWFGPNTVAQVLKKLTVTDKWSKMAVHVAMDNTLVINDVKRLCRYEVAVHNKVRHMWKPLLLVIPLRLGIHEINPVYITALKKCFTFPQSVGVIGGKPNHALYFIGSVGDSVLYLDPHTTQSIGVVDNKEFDHEKKMDASYHYQQLTRINIQQMDPSVAIGFLCKSEMDFDQLVSEMRKSLMSEKQRLFELLEEAQTSWSPDPTGPICSSFHAEQSIYSDDSDDFEFVS